MSCSQNGKFSYGYASSPGKRSSMEDFYETRIDGVEGEVVGLFGVFDGNSSTLFPPPDWNKVPELEKTRKIQILICLYVLELNVI